MDMDADEVRALARAGESFTVEFKRSSRAQDLNDRELVEAAACMANGSGGWLLIGVRDDGTIEGARPRHGSHTEGPLISALILNRTDPPLPVRSEVVDVDGTEVIAIHVRPSPTPVGTRDGVFKRRSTKVDGTPECIPYRPHDMLSAGFSLGGLDYAEVEARGATLDDLDAHEFDRFRRLVATSHGDQSLREASDRDICRALRLLTPDQLPNLGAVLLFGRPGSLARFVPTAECLFRDVTSTSIAVNETKRLPLIAAAEHLYERLEIRNSEEELMVGLLRVAIPRLPPATLREAIANALVHRDYATLGPITVQLDDDRLMVRSPGGFPPGVNLTNLLDESRPRSVVLADAFKRAGLVDRAGRGINEMYSSLLRLGRSGPDYSHSTDASVTVFIPTSGSDMEMMRFVTSYENKQHRALGLTELRILHEIKADGSASLSELQNALNLPTGQLRPSTTRLVEQGLLEARGNGRSRRFHLTAAFYRLAEDQSAYVRVRQADPIQQDQMVMSFVAAYGRITRAQAADLCHLSLAQARAVLKRLVAAGQLELRGSRRGAHYVLPERAHE